MTMSTSRKLNIIGLVVFMVIGTIFAFSPFAIATWKMHSFCRELPAGASYADIQSRAQARGYVVTPLVDGKARVDDPPSYGRRACELTFGERGLSKAE